MRSSSDFYALLSNLFHQIDHSPDTPPVVSLMQWQQWPANSQEQHLLKDLQTALTALQARNHKRQSQMETRMREQSTLLGISQTLASALELKPRLMLDQLLVIVEYTHSGQYLFLHVTDYLHKKPYELLPSAITLAITISTFANLANCMPLAHLNYRVYQADNCINDYS